MTSIWASHPSAGGWRLLSPSQYSAEAELHRLVADEPGLLPLAGSPMVTILGREVRLGAGYADLVAVESTGRLMIIEIKLAGNAESRRAVVAQVMSYAAYLQGITVGQLESAVLASHLRERGGDTVLSVVQAADQQHAVEPQSFAEGLARSLATGDFRPVIVLDAAPDELVQIVGYLQLLTDKIDVDIVTVSAYEVGDARVLVPQRVDPGRRVAELSEAEALARQANAARPGSDDFRAVVASCPPDQRDLLNRLTDWAEQLDNERLIKLETYRGKAGITTLLPRLLGDDVGLVTIYADRGQGYLQFWRTVFERRAPSAAEPARE